MTRADSTVARRRAHTYLQRQTIDPVGFDCSVCQGRGWFRYPDRRYKDGFRPQRQPCYVKHGPGPTAWDRYRGRF